MVIFIMAMRIMFSADLVRISKSFAKRRNPPDHAKVCSIIQRLGMSWNPDAGLVAMSSCNPNKFSKHSMVVPR